ncbi:MAG: hypothetical protein DSM106950_27440 [Stigonema ocellatum SAG 48.90 = DSM 106950]|nr:hypothetical protein [Stigonema ocellatum SAG 48.90 = DSM 106950]
MQLRTGYGCFIFQPSVLVVWQPMLGVDRGGDDFFVVRTLVLVFLRTKVLTTNQAKLS